MVMTFMQLLLVTSARLWSSCTNRIVMHLRQLSLFSVLYLLYCTVSLLSVFLRFLCLCVLLCHCSRLLFMGLAA